MLIIASGLIIMGFIFGLLSVDCGKIYYNTQIYPEHEAYRCYVQLLITPVTAIEPQVQTK